mgnify:CR=1 FL=1
MKLDFDVSLPEVLAQKGFSGAHSSTLKAFIDSGKDIARVVDFQGKDAGKTRNSMYNIVKKRRLPVVVMLRGDDIYLVRKEAVENA